MKVRFEGTIEELRALFGSSIIEPKVELEQEDTIEKIEEEQFQDSVSAFSRYDELVKNMDRFNIGRYMNLEEKQIARLGFHLGFKVKKIAKDLGRSEGAISGYLTSVGLRKNKKKRKDEGTSTKQKSYVIKPEMEHTVGVGDIISS